MAIDDRYGPSVWADDKEGSGDEGARGKLPDNLPEPKFYESEPETDEERADEACDADGGFDKEKLRQYELNKLRYYFAVVEFDSVRTAQAVYDQCDGMEFEASRTELDLRFVPDDLEIEQAPRDSATSVRRDYRPPLFVTKALAHSEVDLTWDKGDSERAETLTWRPALEAIKDDDYAAYLAPVDGDSAAEESEADAEEDEALADLTEKERKRVLKKRKKLLKKKRKAERAKYKAMLLGRLGVDASTEAGGGEDDAGAKEISFKPGLAKKLSEGRAAREAQKSETVFERKLRESKERRKARKRAKKLAEAAAEGVTAEGSDAEFADAEDPFAAWDAAGRAEDVARNVQKKKQKKPVNVAKTASEEAVGAPVDKVEAERQRAEMELLVMGEGGRDGVLGVDDEDSEDEIGERPRKRKMSRKARMKAKAQAKAAAAEAEKAAAKKVIADSRFAQVFTDSNFAIDTTNSQFKQSAGAKLLFEEKLSRRKEAQDRAAAQRIEEERVLKRKREETASAEAAADKRRRLKKKKKKKKDKRTKVSAA
jgi:hypothetical protein